MPKLRRISGKDVMNLLLQEGFILLRQKGSHVRLLLQNGSVIHRVTIPLHTELDRGTLRSIVRSLERCMSEEKIAEIFYS